MNDSKTHGEYIYRSEPSAKMTAARISLVTMYTVFCALYLLLFWVLLKNLALLILLPIIMFAMIRTTWRLVNTEYEVGVEAGELTVAVIYGKAARRVKFRYDVREMSVMTPYDKAHSHYFEERTVTEIKRYGKSKGSDGAFICVCPDLKKSQRTAVVFECNDEIIRLLRLSNPSALKL